MRIKTTDRTLFEQMQISDLEIEYRKNLLAISNADIELLKSCKNIIEHEIDEIVREFYRQQTSIDEIALLIGDADSLARLNKAMRSYVISIFNGYYDNDYVNNRLRIGLVHKRIGVGPKLYLSAKKTLKDIILAAIDKNMKDKQKLFSIYIVLDKIFYLDTTLVFDTYIRSLVSEIETAKRYTEQYAKSLEEKVAQRTNELEALSRRDSLSQLHNQRAMFEILRQELNRAKRHGSKLSIVYFDIDKFKELNDTEGHLKGDEVIASVGTILTKVCRETDYPCRYGGDEFCVIMPETDAESAENLCKRIIKEFRALYASMSISFGIEETLPDESRDIEAIIKDADAKMYISKKSKGYKITR